MSTMERMLSDDLARLIDRLSASVPAGAPEQIRTTTPTLRARLDDVEASLASARAALLEDYARWRRALDDLENVWALAVWRSSVEELVTNAPRRAA